QTGLVHSQYGIKMMELTAYKLSPMLPNSELSLSSHFTICYPLYSISKTVNLKFNKDDTCYLYKSVVKDQFHLWTCPAA
ncbi:12240_t:CDS:1, partial [Ambispora leptoticha]